MRHWMFAKGMDTGCEAQIDARVGGSFRIGMHRGGRDVAHTGQYRIMERPSKRAFTWVTEFTDDEPTL